MRQTFHDPNQNVMGSVRTREALIYKCSSASTPVKQKKKTKEKRNGVLEPKVMTQSSKVEGRYISVLGCNCSLNI